MKPPFQIAILDPSDKAAVAAYERAFYESFRRATANRLVPKLWNWDDERLRLATRIPYEDQVVHTARDAFGAIAAAMGVNVAMRDFQSAAFGFFPACPIADAAEVLTFFSAVPHDLRSTAGLWARGASDLRARGLRTALATTAQRPLRVYQRIGWQVIAEAEREAERRYFLRFDLTAGDEGRASVAVSSAE